MHTPEFPFERDVDNVRWAAADMRVEYPVALDSDYGVWRAFDNHYWPAVYIADAEGRIRHTTSARADTRSVNGHPAPTAGGGGDDIADDLVSVADEGFEAQAEWSTLQSPETYLGYQQAQNFVGEPGYDEPRAYVAPDRLQLNQWALSGDWTIGAVRAC